MAFSPLVISYVYCNLHGVLFLILLAPVAGIFSGSIVPIFRGMMSRTVGADEQGINRITW